MMAWEVVRQDTRASDAPAYSHDDPLRPRRISPVKSAFEADVAVSALSAHQRWAVTVGVDDSLSRELVTPKVTSCRAGIGTRAPLRRERDLEEHQSSVRNGQK